MIFSIARTIIIIIIIVVIIRQIWSDVTTSDFTFKRSFFSRSCLFFLTHLTANFTRQSRIRHNQLLYEIVRIKSDQIQWRAQTAEISLLLFAHLTAAHDYALLALAHVKCTFDTRHTIFPAMFHFHRRPGAGRSSVHWTVLTVFISVVELDQ